MKTKKVKPKFGTIVWICFVRRFKCECNFHSECLFKLTSPLQKVFN